MKLIVKILVGIPASGKSTWSKEFVDKNPQWVRLSRDDFRGMLKNQTVCENKIEGLINVLSDNLILESLNKKLNVIIDNTNLKAEYINHYIDLVKYKADVEFMIFDISLDKSIKRDLDRKNPVGEDVIKRMFKDYLKLLDSFNFSYRKISKKIFKNPILSPDKENVIICDIDGTLAHMNGKRGPFDWKNVFVDDIDEIVAERIRNHHKLGEKVIIVSGRDSECLDETTDWLEFHNIPYHSIFMRKKGDMRKDTIVKKEIYENHIKDKYNVLFVYDDRNSVVDMWRELGIKTFQVEPGNF
jgi:predicted kinase